MSAPDAAPRRRPRGELRLTLALWLALLATLVPLTRVIGPGGWMLGVTLLPAALLGVGFALRRRPIPAFAVTLIEGAIWVAVITAVFFPAQALFAVVPGVDVVDHAVLLVQSTVTEIIQGTSPMAPTEGLSFVLVAAVGVLTIALDHVVLTARMPLLASLALVMVWLIPAIAVPADVDVIAFVLLSVTILYLIRAETRTREAPVMATRGAGVTVVAVAIGTVAILGALVAGPSLPAPVAVAGGGFTTATIDASLDLGRDLRQPNDLTVLTMHSNASQPPYLRVATLSQFNGNAWLPDRTRSVTLEEGLQPVVVQDGIRVTEYRTRITVSQLSSAYLPVPFPAVAVTGLDGIWRTAPYSRTVLTAQSNAQGQDYEVVSHLPRPTLEQIRASRAVLEQSPVGVTSLPPSTPSIVSELAREVTADADTDYDKLIALQSWFRGSDFTYSLTAPVEEGFDDTGAAAVAAFLQEREGYCVHFAAAFAMMARSLDMPARIVVGFLPGEYTGDTADGERVAEVTINQLHAWPEVYFDGIGWVPFEPTKSLGVPTSFSGAAEPTDDSGEDVTDSTATPTPTKTATAGPAQRPDEPTDASGIVAPTIDLRPFLTVLLAVLLAVIAPAVVAAVRRRLRRARGDVGSAWRLVQDAAIDLGIGVSPSESPRAFGARLTALHGAPAAEVGRLVAAVERANYAPARARPDDGADADAFADAETVRTAMMAAAGTGARARATLLPRSLVIRPGSAFADPGLAA